MTTIVDVVVGGQYGSEAKGHVTAQIVHQAAMERDSLEDLNLSVINVRVAGPNAGHTAYDRNYRKFAFRSLPVGAVIDPYTTLYIAPGSEIDLDVLTSEIELAESNGHAVRWRLYVSRQATLIEDRHRQFESEAALTDRVGSTGKGIGAARADRIYRTASTMGVAFPTIPTTSDGSPLWTWAEPEDLYASDALSHSAYQHVVIEGTQGFGLSLRASGNYPYVTSSDCRSIDFLAMAGIDPTSCDVRIQNWVVARVFPIRVAGNSGPLAGETTWEELGLEPEKTTVTQKVRRVGAWDPDLLAAAVRANGGHNANVVITMIDQVVEGFGPEVTEYLDSQEDGEGVSVESLGVPQALTDAIQWIEDHASVDQIGAPVAAFTYSPRNIVWTSAATRQRKSDQTSSVQDVLSRLLGTES